MDEHKEGFRRAVRWRLAARCWAVMVLVLALETAGAGPPAGLRHFELAAGDAALMLNEFSRQSGLQVMFDFNMQRGMKTRAVRGDFEPADALRRMLKGTSLQFEFVNERTLAVTQKKPPAPAPTWDEATDSLRQLSPGKDLEQVLISRTGDSGTTALLGAQIIQFDRIDLDRSPATTVQDFLRTLPQVFGGGPNPDTVLGREAGTNSARGSGINLRGLDAGATLVLLDGKRVAPSGTAGAFDDISNIPLSIIDHIDVMPDGVSAKYGADAVGGVVNLVSQSGRSGLQTRMMGGTVTDGSMNEWQLSQLLGRTRDSGSDMLAFEYFQRDPLRSRDRWQYTSDLTPFGGDNFDFTAGTPGTITDGTRFWPLPRAQSATPIDPASLIPGAPNLFDQYKNTDITPRERRWSAFAKESFSIGEHTDLFLRGLFTRREVAGIAASSYGLDLLVPGTNPFYVNPAGGTGPVEVLTGTAAYFGAPDAENGINTGNFAAGLVISLGAGWRAYADLAYAFEKQHQIQRGLYDPSALSAALADPDPATAFNPFADASANNPRTLAAIAGSGLFESNSNLKTASLTAAGPLLAVGGGTIEASVGAEYRYQSIDTLIADPGVPPVVSGDLSRNITGLFGELRVPFVGETNALAFLKRLELSVGVRRDSFSDTGSGTVPRLGIRWSFDGDLSFRSTWTRAFKAPNLTDMVVNNSRSMLLDLGDPASPDGRSTVLALFGTNPDLRPERARTWTFGAEWAPRSRTGSGISLTYFNIRYSGRVDEAEISPDVLSLPAFDWMVTRSPTSAEIAAACNKTVYEGPAGTCQNVHVAAILDNRLRNITLLETDGIDLIAKYTFSGRAGRFDVGLNGTYLFGYSQANTPGTPLTDIASTSNYPIKLKVRAVGTWSHGPIAATSFINVQGGYHDELSVPRRSVSPWTTVDLQLMYVLNREQADWLGDMQFVLSAENLFDVYPPFLNNQRVGVGYDQENADLYGRIVRFQVRKKW
jgi:outer membrane receptor protein involved in Fe transport